MLMGFYGLTKKEPVLALEFPEYVLSNNELKQVRYNYSEAKEINQKIDHISCHDNGKFHLKTKGDPDTQYIHKLLSSVPLGPDVPVFLKFIVISDVASSYQVTTKKPKDPHVPIRLEPNQYLSLKCMFSGANYNLKKALSDTLSATIKRGPLFHSAVILNSSSLQGGFFWEIGVYPEEAKAKRPCGTIVSFQFPTQDKKNILKTFVVN